MYFLVVGTNHKYSSIKLREKLASSKRKIRSALVLLKKRCSLKGAVILSTCNRTEIYASASNSEAGISDVVDFISEYFCIEKDLLFSSLYIYEGKGALRHLCGVCAGLDSMITGELQILGQVKASLEESQGADFVDGFLKDIFKAAIYNAKTIHEKTKISEGKVSVGSVAVDFIKQKVGVLNGKNILIVGVGKITELVLKYLREEGPCVIFISNRTFDKAKKLAGEINAEALRFDNLRESLKRADVIITATASPHFIIKKETLREVKRPLLIVDLAMPRDVEPQVKELDNIELYSLEDLGSVIKKNMDRKTEEAKKASRMIDIEVEKLWAEFLESEKEPVLLP